MSDTPTSAIYRFYFRNAPEVGVDYLVSIEAWEKIFFYRPATLDEAAQLFGKMLSNMTHLDLVRYEPVVK